MLIYKFYVNLFLDYVEMYLEHFGLSTWATSFTQDLHNIRGITFGIYKAR